jgi:hypothetical protein
MSVVYDILEPEKDVDDIPELKALDDEKEFAWEQKYSKVQLVAKRQKILDKFKNYPNLFHKKKRASRDKFMGRCDKQLGRLKRKEAMWNARKANCAKLAVYDAALDAIDGQLEDLNNLDENKPMKKKRARAEENPQKSKKSKHSLAEENPQESKKSKHSRSPRASVPVASARSQRRSKSQSESDSESETSDSDNDSESSGDHAKEIVEALAEADLS